MSKGKHFEVGAFTDLVNRLIHDPACFDWYYHPANADALPKLHKHWGISEEQAKALRSRDAAAIQGLVLKDLEAKRPGGNISPGFTHVMQSFGS